MEKWDYLVLEQPAGVLGFVDRGTREQYPGSLNTVLAAVGAEGWQVMSLDTAVDGRTTLVLGRKAGQSFA
jgi:hypothetical protein